MDAIGILIAGVFVAINIIVIMYKIKKDRYLDALIDGSLLVILAITFGGTYSGLVTATVASSVISMYLLAVPPKFEV